MTKLQETGGPRGHLIFFLSDNGGITGYLESLEQRAADRRRSPSCSKAVFVCPCLVRWPAKLPAGRVYQPMVSVLDIVPTVLAAAETRTQTGRVLDGVELTSCITGKRSDPPHGELFWRYGPNWAVRSGSYKLLHSRDLPVQLYDLNSAVGETHDLAAAQPEIVQPLRQRWEQWNSELVPPAWSQPSLPPPW